MNREKVVADVVKSYNRLDSYSFQEVWDMKRMAAKIYKFMGLLVVAQAVMTTALFISIYAELVHVTAEIKPLVDAILVVSPIAIAFGAFLVHLKRKKFYALNTISTDELNALAQKYTKS